MIRLLLIPGIIIGLLPSTVFAAQKFTAVDITIKNNSMLFTKEVARLCLSTPDSSIEIISPSEIRVNERSSACAQEIKTLASEWDGQTPPDKMTAIYTRKEKKPALEKTLHAQYPDHVKTASSANCPC